MGTSSTRPTVRGLGNPGFPLRLPGPTHPVADSSRTLVSTWSLGTLSAREGSVKLGEIVDATILYSIADGRTVFRPWARGDRATWSKGVPVGGSRASLAATTRRSFLPFSSFRSATGLSESGLLALSGQWGSTWRTTSYRAVYRRRTHRRSHPPRGTQCCSAPVGYLAVPHCEP